TDEGDSLARTGGGQVRILGEEPVSRIDRVGTGGLGRLDDRVDREIGPDGMALLADLVCLVRLQAVDRIAVLVREDGNRSDTELVRRTEGSDGDLAAVGNQDFREH